MGQSHPPCTRSLLKLAFRAPHPAALGHPLTAGALPARPGAVIEHDRRKTPADGCRWSVKCRCRRLGRGHLRLYRIKSPCGLACGRLCAYLRRRGKGVWHHARGSLNTEGDGGQAVPFFVRGAAPPLERRGRKGLRTGSALGSGAAHPRGDLERHDPFRRNFVGTRVREKRGDAGFGGVLPIARPAGQRGGRSRTDNHLVAL